jgi:hypothetical protein
MTNAGFVATLTLTLCALMIWACRVLPAERWQMLAASPTRRSTDGTWASVNWTFYGFFTATAVAVSVSLGLILMAAIGVAPSIAAAIVVALLSVCWPSARLVARIVERKRHTFTVGGATFVGVLIGPWLIVVIGRFGAVPYVPSLAAMCIGIAAGEAIGRLACISFGCCYGRPLGESPRAVRRLFGRASFRFSGATKKAVYAGGFEGVPLIPIQGLTAAILGLVAVVATSLFLSEQYVSALLLAGVGAQLWRAISEMLRADYRGGGRITTYQKLAIGGAIYLTLAAFAPMLVQVGATQWSTPDIASGLSALWSAEAIVSLEALWATIFVYTGRSTVTGSTLSFHVKRERI